MRTRQKVPHRKHQCRHRDGNRVCPGDMVAENMNEQREGRGDAARGENHRPGPACQIL